MIKSAATSVSGSLALNLGVQAVPADDTAVSNDFAALLDSTVATGQDGVADQAASLEQAIGQHMRQAAGNTAGKKLPLALPDVASALADAAKPADGAAEEAAAADEITPALPAVTSEIILPGLVVPIFAQEPQTSAATATPAPAARSTAGTLAKAAAQAIPSPLPAPTEIVLAAKTEKAQPALAALTPAATPVAAPTPGLTPASPARAPEGSPIVASFTVPQTVVGDPRQAPAIVAASPTIAEEIRVSIVPIEQSAPLAHSTSAQLASAQAARPAVAAAPAVAPEAQQPAAPRPAEAAVPPAPAPATATQATSTPAAPIQTTPAQPILAQAAAARAVPEEAKPNGAAAPRREATTRGASAPAADVPSVLAQTLAADKPAAPAPTPAAIVAQPLFALQDGQSFSQAMTPVTAAPTTGVNQTGHDFATLVDRLVEAREAAMPGTVQAAISHSEFGQVSLRFEQDANGLSVAMSSADPEFAQAVQASSAGSQTASDNGSGAPRQDKSDQQQTAGSPSGQPQSQAQSSAFGRGDRSTQTQTDSRSGRPPGQHTQDDEATDTRGGIYA